MERDDVVLLLLREAAALEVGAEVVDPPEAAALAAAVQPGEPGDGAPAADAVPDDVVVELLVFLGRPQPLAVLRLGLLARLAPHRFLRNAGRRGGAGPAKLCAPRRRLRLNKSALRGVGACEGLRSLCCLHCCVGLCVWREGSPQDFIDSMIVVGRIIAGIRKISHRLFLVITNSLRFETAYPLISAMLFYLV